MVTDTRHNVYVAVKVRCLDKAYYIQCIDTSRVFFNDLGKAKEVYNFQKKSLTAIPYCGLCLIDIGSFHCIPGKLKSPPIIVSGSTPCLDISRYSPPVVEVNPVYVLDADKNNLYVGGGVVL